MHVIVEHYLTEKRYVLLDTAYGRMAPHPSGSPFAMGEPETYELLAVCDPDGEIMWLRSDVLRVVSVDGKTPKELLAPDAQTE